MNELSGCMSAAPARPRHASRLTLSAALSLALLSPALSGCARGGGGRGGFAMPPTPVEVEEARPRVVRDRFRALGSVQSRDNIEVVSELNAIVVELPFTEGQSVARGALLARLDDREIRAAADRATAQHERAASDQERAQKLFEQQAISQRELDDARTAERVAAADEALAHARLDKTRIRAPFTGLAGRRRVSPGAYLKSGDVITDLARVDEMEVSFAAPERYAGVLRPGVTVEVTAPAFPRRSFNGRVSVVDPVVNADSRTFSLLARIPNPQALLRPGMSADVSVTLSERAGALAVSDEAVFAEGSQSYVFRVKEDSTVTKTAVTLGTRDSSAVEIVSGLEPGARVVRAGHQKLYEGAKVMPVPSGEPAAAAPGAAGPAPSAAAPAKGAARKGGAR